MLALAATCTGGCSHEHARAPDDWSEGRDTASHGAASMTGNAELASVRDAAPTDRGSPPPADDADDPTADAGTPLEPMAAMPAMPQDAPPDNTRDGVSMPGTTPADGANAPADAGNANPPGTRAQGDDDNVEFGPTADDCGRLVPWTLPDETLGVQVLRGGDGFVVLKQAGKYSGEVWVLDAQGSGARRIGSDSPLSELSAPPEGTSQLLRAAARGDTVAATVMVDPLDTPRADYLLFTSDRPVQRVASAPPAPENHVSLTPAVHSDGTVLLALQHHWVVARTGAMMASPRGSLSALTAGSNTTRVALEPLPELWTSYGDLWMTASGGAQLLTYGWSGGSVMRFVNASKPTVLSLGPDLLERSDHLMLSQIGAWTPDESATLVAVASDESGRLAAAGMTGGDNDPHPWVQLVELPDRALWSSGQREGSGVGRAVALAPNGDVVVAGNDSTVGTLWLQRYDETGAARWPGGIQIADEHTVQGVSVQSNGTVLVAAYPSAYIYCE